MRKIISVSLWASVPVSAFANIGTVPEPETLSLLGLGLLAFITHRLINNKH
jgi:hypothetical protein